MNDNVRTTDGQEMHPEMARRLVQMQTEINQTMNRCMSNVPDDLDRGNLFGSALFSAIAGMVEYVFDAHEDPAQAAMLCKMAVNKGAALSARTKGLREGSVDLEEILGEHAPKVDEPDSGA